QRRLVLVRADAGELDADDLVLGHAGGAVHALQAPADHEQRVADDRAAQRDLEHDQRGRGLVPAQRGQDGTRSHWKSPKGRYCDLSCIAGASWQACHAGTRPASTLAKIASTKVVVSISGSRWTRSA